MAFMVYGLYRPGDDNPFYIGKGRPDRPYKHFKNRPKGTSLKENIIKKILDSGNTPVVKILFQSDIEQECFDEEIRLIGFYGRIVDNSGILSNITAGGSGGDTVTGCVPEEIKKRYDKRSTSMNNRSDEEKEKTSNKVSTSLKNTWKENKDNWSLAIKTGISVNRDRERHAASVSAGWNNRSDEEKEKTSIKKRELRLKAWRDPIKRKNLIKGSQAISIPVQIEDIEGNVYIADSLLGWCKENNHSYDVLWKILHGNGPKPNKYKKSKYLGWKVCRINKK